MQCLINIHTVYFHIIHFTTYVLYMLTAANYAGVLKIEKRAWFWIWYAEE